MAHTHARCGLRDTRHTTHDTRHMVTFEWKIEYYDPTDLKSGDIIDVDYYRSLSQLLDSIEQSEYPAQVCLVREEFAKYPAASGTRSHLYFAEREKYDEQDRTAPARCAEQIRRNKARIAALVAAGRILTDDQIGGP